MTSASDIPPRFNFAPVGLIRVASWPTESLDGFGDHELAARARTIDSTNSRELAQFSRDYDACIGREREQLWERTEGDERFLKALTVANPALSMAAQQRRGARQNKRMHHMETTLYRHLARAVGRTEPDSAWAGVSVVKRGPRTRAVRVDPRYVVMPDLTVFNQLLQRLGERRTYARRQPWRTNPTLLGGERHWLFWAVRDGELYRHTVARDPLLDAALQSIAELDVVTTETLEAELGVSDLDPFVGQLCAAGLLVGGGELPPFSDAWAALEGVSDRFDPSHRNAWDTALRALRTSCQDLAEGFEAMPLAEVRAHIQRAELVVAQLHDALELTPESSTRSVLRVDTCAGWQVELSHDDLVHLHAVLVAYESSASVSPKRILRDALRRRRAAVIGSDPVPLGALDPLAWQLDLSGVVTCEEAAARLGAPSLFNTEPSPGPPVSKMGAMLARLIAGTHGSPRVQMLGVADEAASLYSRFARSLGPDDAPLLDWMATHLREVAPGATVAAWHDPRARVPGVLAHPNYQLRRVTLWSADAQACSLSDVRVIGDPKAGTLRLIGSDGPFVVVAPTAANQSALDPFTELVLASSGRESRVLELPRAADLDVWLPATTLAGGDLIAVDRVTMGAGWCDQLARVRGAERFIVWQKAQIPASMVRAHRPGATDVLVVRDSPLAVSAFTEGHREGPMRIECASTSPWLSDGQRHYHADLVLPFVRQDDG